MALPWWAWAAGAVLLANLVGVVEIVRDKRRAGRRGVSRVPERRLLLWAVLGGWPLMWLAMHRVRHKTRKCSFRAPFFFVVSLWATGAVLLSLLLH